MIVKNTWRKRLTAFMSTANRYSHASPDIMRKKAALGLWSYGGTEKGNATAGSSFVTSTGSLGCSFARCRARCEKGFSGKGIVGLIAFSQRRRDTRRERFRGWSR